MVAFTVSEWHQVTSNKMYDVDDEEIIDAFGSIERFVEIMSHQDQQMFDGMDPHGEEPTDEEHDAFWDFINDCDYDRDDDWLMDRKGGYEVTIKLD